MPCQNMQYRNRRPDPNPAKSPQSKIILKRTYLDNYLKSLLENVKLEHQNLRVLKRKKCVIESQYVQIFHVMIQFLMCGRE